MKEILAKAYKVSRHALQNPACDKGQVHGQGRRKPKTWHQRPQVFVPNHAPPRNGYAMLLDMLLNMSEPILHRFHP